MKKLICIFSVMLVAVCSIFAQQIQMFGVIDTDTVYTTYFRESSAARNYDAKKAEFQAEIDDRDAKLQELEQQKIEYEKNGNTVAALRLEEQIIEEVEFLTNYIWVQNKELEDLRENLEDSDTFYKDFYQAIINIAESEGYSIILSLQQDAVIYYNSDVDITDKVIRRLGQ